MQQPLASSSLLGWKHPVFRRFKCNVDASFLVSRNRVDIGLCIYDNIRACVVNGSRGGIRTISCYYVDQ